MFAALADTALAGVPMLAVCARTVFGGASMLSCVAQQRLFFERSLFGMSGPRIVQAVAGVDDFNAEDKAFVTSVMGGTARAARGQGLLLTDDADVTVRSACAQWVSEHCAVGTQDAKTALEQVLIAQRQTLERDGLTRGPRVEKVPTAQLVAEGEARNPSLSISQSAYIDDGLLLGRTTDGGYLYGFVNGIWADSWHAWKLTNALLSQLQSAPKVPVHIVLNCPAHATNRALEAGMISQYFSLLGVVLRAFRTYGATVTLHITGEAAGGVHVALAGGASHVVAHTGANIRVLPKIASDQIRTDGVEPTREQWIATGVTDA
jgi:hypothetical protein